MLVEEDVLLQGVKSERVLLDHSEHKHDNRAYPVHEGSWRLAQVFIPLERGVEGCDLHKHVQGKHP